MSATPTFRFLRPPSSLPKSDSLFALLTPSIRRPARPLNCPVAPFSTSSTLWKGTGNKRHGISALRNTGWYRRPRLSVRIEDLPKPVIQREGKEPAKGDEEHGLWGFFKDKTLLQTPVQESRHGRAWTVPELRMRSWDDLHSLWWVCVKERNRLATEKLERDRETGLFGDAESKERDETVQETMKAIMDTLIERKKAWQEAYQLAAQDPTVDLVNNRHDVNPYSSDPEDYQELEPAEASEQSTKGKEDKIPA